MVMIVALTVFADNPVIRHMYTADPSAMVYNDTFWLFTGHDEGSTGYVMNDWHIYSSTDMVNWTTHGACLAVTAFSWASKDAWAGQCTYRNGKFYWYVPMTHRTISGKAIGVAVATKITGPYTDAKGSAIITNNMTTDTNITWDDIDPTIFIDVDSQAYLYWGNHSTYMVRLKSNMYDTMGSIVSYTSTFKPWNYEEAPWVYKRNSVYYFAFADSFPEYIDYATSISPLGPWTRRGKINNLITGCGTNHEAILEYKGKWYFVYHSAGLPSGGDYKRSVCIDTIGYNTDNTLKPVTMTTTGVAPVGTAPVKANTSYRIVSRLTGKVLQVASGAAQGATIQQRTWAGTDNQLWLIDSVGYGVYRIVNVQTGFCMDVLNGTLTDGTVIQQLAYSGAAKHKWRLMLTPDGYVAFVNVNSGKAVDILNGSTADAAVIDQLGYIYTTANATWKQQWQLIEQTVAVVPSDAAGSGAGETIALVTGSSGKRLVVIKGKNLRNLRCAITDLKGKRVYQKTSSDDDPNRVVLALPGTLPRGVYLLALRSEGWVDSKRILIR